MQTQDPKPVQKLASGQLWQMRAASIEIMKLGKRLIHYRVTSHLERNRVSVQISGIGAMEKYLQANSARLLRGSSSN